MAREKEYQRLPGWGTRRRGLFAAGRCRIWLGRDHLLCSDYAWYKEDYKRFYFRDIQAIIIRKTVGGKIVNGILTGLAVPSLAAAIVLSDGFRIFFFIIAAFFLLFLLINTLYGPTCVTRLRTAVQTEELPSLNRLWRARKVLARIRPIIAETQGGLVAEEIPARMADLVHPPIANPVQPASEFQPPVEEAPPENPPQS